MAEVETGFNLIGAIALVTMVVGCTNTQQTEPAFSCRLQNDSC
jgi:hypothetical protein